MTIGRSLALLALLVAAWWPAAGRAEIELRLTGAGAYLDNASFNAHAEDWVRLGAAVLADQGIGDYALRAGKLHWGWGPMVEARYVHAGDWVIGAGVGYLSVPASEFRQSYADPVHGTHERLQQFSGGIVPFAVCAAYRLRLDEAMHVDIGPFGEYYLGRFTLEHKREVVNGLAGDLAPRADYLGQGWGGGVRLEAAYRLTPHLAVHTGIQARLGRLTHLTGNIRQADGSHAEERFYSYDMQWDGRYYHRWESLTSAEKAMLQMVPTPYHFGMRDVQEAEMVLSGIGVTLGLGYRF
jgi:hypothetical protein